MVAPIPFQDSDEGARERGAEQFNELVPVARPEALPVLPEGPTGYVANVEEIVGGATDLRAPLFARVEADPG